MVHPAGVGIWRVPGPVRTVTCSFLLIPGQRRTVRADRRHQRRDSRSPGEKPPAQYPGGPTDKGSHTRLGNSREGVPPLTPPRPPATDPPMASRAFRPPLAPRPAQARVILYIVLSLVPFLLLLPFLGGNELKPLDPGQM